MAQQLLKQFDSNDDKEIQQGLFNMIEDIVSGTKFPDLIYDAIAKIMSTDNGPKNKLVRQLCYDVLAIGCSEGNDSSAKAIVNCLKVDIVAVGNPDITLSALRATQSLPYRYQFEFVRTLKPDFLKKPLLHENPSVRQQALRTFLSLVLRIYPTLNTPPIPHSYESQIDRTMATTDCRDHINDIMRGVIDMREDKDERVLLELYTQLNILFYEYYTHNIVSIDSEINQLESADDYERINSGGNALLPLLLLIVKLSLPQIKMIASASQSNSMISSGSAALFGSYIMQFALNELQSTGLIFDCEIQLESTPTPFILHIKEIALEWGNYTLVPLLSSSNYEIRYCAAKGMSCILNSELLMCPVHWSVITLCSIIPMTMNKDTHGFAELARIIGACSKYLPPNVYLQKLNQNTYYEQFLKCALFIENTTERLQLLRQFHKSYIERSVMETGNELREPIKFILNGDYILSIFNTVKSNSFREEIAYTFLLPFAEPPHPINKDWVHVVLPILTALLQCLFWKSDAPSGHLVVEALNNISEEIYQTTDKQLIREFGNVWPVLIEGLPKIKVPLVLDVLHLITQYTPQKYASDIITDRIKWVVEVKAYVYFKDITEKDGDEQLIMLIRSIKMYGLRFPENKDTLITILNRTMVKEYLSGFIVDEIEATKTLLRYQVKKTANQDLLESLKKPSSNSNDKDFGFGSSNVEKIDYRIQCEISVQSDLKANTRSESNTEIGKTFESDQIYILSSSNDPIYVTARKRLCPQTFSFLIEYTLYNLTNTTFRQLKLNVATNGKVVPVKPVVLPTPLYAHDKITIPFALKLKEIEPFQCLLYITYINAVEPIDIAPKCKFSGDFNIKTTSLKIGLNDLLWSPNLIPNLALYRMIWNSQGEEVSVIIKIPDNLDTLDFRPPWKKIDTPMLLIDGLYVQAAVVNTLKSHPIYGVIKPLPSNLVSLSIKSKDDSFFEQFILNSAMYVNEWFGYDVKIVKESILQSTEPKTGVDRKDDIEDCNERWKKLRKRRQNNKK